MMRERLRLSACRGGTAAALSTLLPLRPGALPLCVEVWFLEVQEGELVRVWEGSRLVQATQGKGSGAERVVGVTFCRWGVRGSSTSSTSVESSRAAVSGCCGSVERDLSGVAPPKSTELSIDTSRSVKRDLSLTRYRY